eukprot:TRINITY_DN620_c0_g4_i1.p1 TRINITY_DN620_c0_g4~~TRINITY_DN620_c0_g4_i1.p1  ORF type:complete len:712 (+),score=103.70 TRINITY_DN620_c0_g4_i1:199-2334(+)
MSCTYETYPSQNPASLSDAPCSDMLGEHAHGILPTLSLHMLHSGTSQSRRGSMLAPLSMQAIRDLAKRPGAGALGNSVMDSELVVEVASRLAGCKQPMGMPTEVTLGKQSIRVSTPSHEVEIPLALSEVCCKECDGRYSVICIILSSEDHDVARGEDRKRSLASELHVGAPPAGATRHHPDKVVWLFKASGNQLAMDNLMGIWSTLGVIRSDFLRSVDVSPRLLGEGGCAMVYLGKSRSAASSAPVAVKIMTRTGKEAEAMIHREVRFMLAVQGHPGCIGFQGLYKYVGGSSSSSFVPELNGESGADQDLNCIRWAMVMAYYPKGDLFSFVEDQGRLPEAKAKPIIQGMLSALSHIHQAGIIHRDVKPENILMTSDCRPVLADFGIAVHVDDTMGLNSLKGSPGYMAPELLRGLPYGTKSDVFGAGATLFFMLTGSLAFDAHTPEKIVENNRKCSIRFQTSVLRALSDKTKVFLRLLLEADPMLRPEAADVLAWPGKFASQPPKEEMHQCAQDTSSRSVTRPSKESHIPRFAEASDIPSHDSALRQFPIKAPTLPKTQTAPHRQKFLKRPSSLKANAQEDSLSSPTGPGSSEGRLTHSASVSSSASTALLSESSGDSSSDANELMFGQARSCGELDLIRHPASGSLILPPHARSCGVMQDISESSEEGDDDGDEQEKTRRIASRLEEDDDDDDEKEQAKGEQMDDEEQDRR